MTSYPHGLKQLQRTRVIFGYCLMRFRCKCGWKTRWRLDRFPARPSPPSRNPFHQASEDLHRHCDKYRPPLERRIADAVSEVFKQAEAPK